MDGNRIYLDSYVLQQDMRIRLPKSILTNMNAKKGESWFDIYYDTNDDELILKIKQTVED